MNFKHAHLDECEAYGVDPVEVERIARNLAKWAEKAAVLGMEIFGSGEGDLRATRPSTDKSLILAEIGPGFSGGAGYVHIGEDGLQRGE